MCLKIIRMMSIKENHQSKLPFITEPRKFRASMHSIVKSSLNEHKNQHMECKEVWSNLAKASFE
jgi:hypothetical protein